VLKTSSNLANEFLLSLAWHLLVGVRNNFAHTFDRLFRRLT